MAETLHTRFAEASNLWLEAAIGTGLILRIKGAQEAQWGAHYYLLQLSRLQYACELSFHRVNEDLDLSKSKEHDTKMAGLWSIGLEIHSFLVSAHSHWQVLEQLSRLLNVSELKL